MSWVGSGNETNCRVSYLCKYRSKEARLVKHTTVDVEMHVYRSITILAVPDSVTIIVYNALGITVMSTRLWAKVRTKYDTIGPILIARI